MVGHKTSLNKFKEIEIISSIFSDHNGLELETNLKEYTQKHLNIWRLNKIGCGGIEQKEKNDSLT